MKENFASPVLPFTLRYEGGTSDDPRDPGGRTNQGITQTTYAAYRKAAGKPPADVFAISTDERDAIYRDRYWAVLQGDELPSGVDLACFDLGVNSGPARARAFLEAAGGQAKAAADPAGTVQAICAKRLGFLHGLRTFETFGRGWTARVAACEALGVKMALQARTGQPVDAAPTKGATLILNNEARKASAQASSVARVAKGAGAGGLGAGGATPALSVGHAGHLLVWVALAGVGLAVATGLLAWRAWQHRVRAVAYAATAGGA